MDESTNFPFKQFKKGLHMENNHKLATLVVTSLFTALLTNGSNSQMVSLDANFHETEALGIEMVTCGQCNGPYRAK